MSFDSIEVTALYADVHPNVAQKVGMKMKSKLQVTSAAVKSTSAAAMKSTSAAVKSTSAAVKSKLQVTSAALQSQITNLCDSPDRYKSPQKKRPSTPSAKSEAPMALKILQQKYRNVQERRRARREEAEGDSRTSFSATDRGGDMKSSAVCSICNHGQPNAKLRSCGHSTTCMSCTSNLMAKGLPCPQCSEPIMSYGISLEYMLEQQQQQQQEREAKAAAKAVKVQSEGVRGFLSSLATIVEDSKITEADHINKLRDVGRRKKFKEIFPNLRINCTVRATESIQMQLIQLIRSNDIQRLENLARVASPLILDDQQLYVVVRKRILEVLENGVVGGVASELVFEQILDACSILGKACSLVGAKLDAEIYYTRAKVGYENLHGADHEKSLYSALSLFMNMKLKTAQDVRLLRNLAERMEMSLGEAEAIEPFQMCAIAYAEHGNIEEAREVWEKCLEYQENSLGLKHRSTLATVENLGVLEEKDGNFEIALEYFERALKGKEKALGEKHQETLLLLMTIAAIFEKLDDSESALVLYDMALKGFEATLGKDDKHSLACARNYMLCLNDDDDGDKNITKLEVLLKKYPHMVEEFLHLDSGESTSVNDSSASTSLFDSESDSDSEIDSESESESDSESDSEQEEGSDGDVGLLSLARKGFL
ncbi:hypothetical protein TrST_g1888 [Triparma strigata]|uniref:RING-type domain-containing protein n=1 Tax=Triparma strigata TaxID=1606541 RepID=A0A9W7BRY4_9STRA|nr:hypothetical protein TrST_g1888 [Triparma strigata]